MSRYLTVGVSQVQTWIGRSPDLVGRRGASALLTEATSKASWQGRVDGWEWNDEAGEVAGIVALKCESEESPELDTATSQVAAAILARLRKELPAANLEASWADADSYALSVPLTQRQRDEGRSLISLPAPVENALAHPCQACNQAAATTTADRDKQKLCLDCAAREKAAGNSSRAAGALRPIIEQLVQDGDQEAFARLPKDMKALAQTGGASPDAQTRVAVVYADGNNLGAVLKKLAESEGLAAIAKGVDEATKAAFVEAAREHCLTMADNHGRRAVGIIPHIVGGDDVVASVAAPFAWDFVVAFAEKFVAGLSTQAWLADKGVDIPDISVGMVFQHCSEPLTQSFDRAATRLSEAKRMEVASLNWVDLQIDDPGQVHSSREVAWVSEHLPLARWLADRPAHFRQTLRSGLSSGSRSWPIVTETLRRQQIDDPGYKELMDIVPQRYAEASAQDLLWLLQIARDVRST